MSEPPPPPLPPKESLIKRYKLIWRLLLNANLALGAYMFVRASRKDSGIVNSKSSEKSVGDEKEKSVGDEKAAAKLPSDPITNTDIPIPEILDFPPPLMEPVKVRQPIPEDQQRELFQWMLEEKRKIKPKDSQEKKQIDGDKAILKQFIRAKSVPGL
ncbi:uncharacterized protein LOC142609079 [Castanea sativa]|uniref:uncharacterized protein LOC142609079 n=1 Tax=Castanea sativa TaxID=21020 RepID=UPI003F651EEB